MNLDTEMLYLEQTMLQQHYANSFICSLPDANSPESQGAAGCQG